MPEKQPAVNILIVLLVAAAAIALGSALRHTVSSFLLSFVLAYLVDPLVVMLERRKIKRIYGILILYATLGVLGVFCFAYIVPLININWETLVTNLPKYVQKGKDIVLGTAGKFQPVYAADEWQWLFDKVSDSMDNLLNKVGSGIYAAVGSVAFNLLNLLLAPILVFFMLFYKHDISVGITAWLPPRKREAILELGHEINASVGGYIRGQMFVSLIVAILATIAFLPM